MMFAHNYFADLCYRKYLKMVEDMKNKDYSLMDLMHHYTTGGKSVFTQECQDSLYRLRECVGGAGFTVWSGLPQIIDDYAPEVTYEGDNTVMAQQCANFLLKQAKRVNVKNMKE